MGGGGVALFSFAVFPGRRVRFVFFLQRSPPDFALVFWVIVRCAC